MTNNVRQFLKATTFRITSAALSIALILSSAAAQEVSQRAQQVIRFYADNKRFMGAVLVAQGAKVVLDQGYGAANLEWDIPNTPSSKFRIGSMTKQFTAAAILLLEERGKLKTDDPIKKYIPDAPSAWDKVTIYHLLTHTSGIQSFTSFPDYPSTEATPTTPEKLVARFQDKPLNFQPGADWEYSNSGYVLLGYLLEKVSGKTYADFVQENFFKPLGMNDSGYDSNSAIIPHRAAGYSSGPHGIVNTGYIDMSIPFSAGALYSTTHDLFLWEQALFGSKVLSPTSLKKMTTPFKHDYGCGVFVRTDKGRQVIEHGGGIEGFNTQMSYYPDDRLTVIVLGNLNGGAPGAIASSLSSLMHGDKVVLPTERKEVAVSKEILGRYVGTYELMPKFSIVISLDGDQLKAQATNQPKFSLFAESETKFFLKVVDAELEFSKNDKDDFTSLTLYQNGQQLKGTRKQ